ncbi:MAG: META domain-containing protein, partial [Desulfobacterales bacterium]|nr:META domain-containing protein [Desulfobacterales bacterium]
SAIFWQDTDSLKKEALSMKPKVVLFIFALFLIGACSQTERLRLGVEAFNSTDWVLEEIDGSAVVDRVQSTLRFQRNDRIVAGADVTAISPRFVRVLNFSKWAPSVRPGGFARRR